MMGGQKVDVLDEAGNTQPCTDSKAAIINARMVKWLLFLCAALAIALICCAVAIVLINTNFERSLDESKAAKGRSKADGQDGRKVSKPPPHVHSSRCPHMRTTASRDAETTKRYMDTTKRPPHNDTQEECTTTACKAAAAEFLSRMDATTSPCDDFYQYACGGWINRTEIPDNQLEVSSVADIATIINTRSKQLLEMPIVQSDLEAIKKKKLVYKSCMDTDAFEKDGVEPILNIMRDNNISWPIVFGKPQHDYNLFNESIRYAQLGLNSLFHVGMYMYGGEKILAVVANPPYLLSQSTPTTIGHLRTYLTDTMAILKPGVDVSDHIEDMLVYQQNLSDLYAQYVQKPIKETFKVMKLKDLQKEIGANYEIERAMIEVLGHPGINITITGDYEVFTIDLDIFKKEVNLMQRFNKSVLANMLAFKNFQVSEPYMPKNIRKVYSAFYKGLYNSDPPPHWKTCIKGMAFATTRMYADKYFPPSFKSQVDEMMGVLKAQTQMTLALTKWMDAATKKRAIKKSAKMTYDNAYPTWILNDTLLNEEYQLVEASLSAAPCINAMSVVAAEFANQMKMLTNTDRDYIWDPPLNVNAGYVLLLNQVRIYAGMLQPPFYRDGTLKAVNYGAIGSIIGHEMLHGFDTAGRERDENGQMFDWWTEQSRENYDKGVTCIVEQYGNYTIASINKTVDAWKTKGENIADIGGVNCAFRAYRNWAEHVGHEEPRLAGVDLSPNQLFFLSWANMWCNKQRPAMTNYLHLTNSHAFNKYRVIGSLQGHTGFAEAYNCPRGSRMNPGPQCELW